MLMQLDGSSEVDGLLAFCVMPVSQPAPVQHTGSPLSASWDLQNAAC